MKPTTEWWLQERENQLDLAQLHYGFFGNKCATAWHCLFLWATPDIWNDPEPEQKPVMRGWVKDGGNWYEAEAKAFYGFPHGPVSASNAGGKCVTAGETAPKEST